MSLPLTEHRTAAGYPYWIADGRRPHWLTVTHGAFGAHGDLTPVLEPALERHNLLLWDLPGHGAASHFAPCRRLDGVAHQLIEIMDAASVTRARHLGFSFGGMVIQRFARLFPERTSALIAYACVPITLIKAPPHWLVHALTKLQFSAMSWHTFAAAFSQQVSIVPQHEARFYEAMIVQSPRVRDALYEAMIYGASYEPKFHNNAPMAQIKGNRDDRFPGAKEAMDALSTSLPDDLVETIPGAGHLAHSEQPAAFQAALARILTRLDDSLA